MEYTFPTPAIRRTVREFNASFSDADDTTDDFGVKVPLTYVGGRVPSSNAILEIARAEGYTLVGGSFVPSREFPEDSDYAGEKYKGHLDLRFEPDDWVDTDSDVTVSDILASVERLVENTKVYDDYTQFRINGGDSDSEEEVDITEPIQQLQTGDIKIEDVSATEAEHRGNSHVFIRIADTTPDPYRMPGINERESMALHRHEALTLVEALDQYDGDRKTGRLRGKLIETHNLERYLQHLDN